MADVTNIEVGEMTVSFNGVALGHTKGDVVFSYEVDYYEVTTNQYGPGTMVDKVTTGQRLLVTVPIEEYTLDNLKIAIPHADDSVSGKLLIGSDAGQKLSTVAAQLILHPKERAVSDISKDIVFYKAAVHDTVEVTNGPETERIIEVQFLALLDESKSDGNYLGLIGDSTAV